MNSCFSCFIQSYASMERKQIEENREGESDRPGGNTCLWLPAWQETENKKDPHHTFPGKQSCSFNDHQYPCTCCPISCVCQYSAQNVISTFYKTASLSLNTTFNYFVPAVRWFLYLDEGLAGIINILSLEDLNRRNQEMWLLSKQKNPGPHSVFLTC